MLRKSWKIYVVLAVVLLQLVFPHLSAFLPSEDIRIHALENSQNDTMTIITSPENLYFEQNEILVKKDGVFYEVTNLEKHENQWVATVAFKGYCIRGHQLCDNCGLCHQRTCAFFVPFCNKWK